jgi:PAS domain S-box-containing protein
MLFDQTLEEIRQEITQAELAGVSDEEYIALLTRHTANLLELVEKLNSEASQVVNLEAVLNLLFRNLSEPICVIDERLVILFCNDYWKRLFKNRGGDCGLLDFISKKDYMTLEKSVQKAGGRGKREIVTLRSEHSRKLISILPFHGFDKEFRFLLFALDDLAVRQITLEKEQSVTESGIRPGEKKDTGALRSEVLPIIDGFQFVIDKKCIIRSVSSEALRMLSFRRNELIGKNIRFLLQKNYLDQFDRVLEESDASGRKVRTEVELIDKQKVTRFFEITLVQDTDPSGWRGVALDIDRFRQREKDLINARENAEQNDKRKSDFLANLSHEIRTPLNGIVGFSSMLSRDDLKPEKREKYVRIIRSSTAQLLTLVNDIIDHSKIEAGRLKIIYSKVNIHQLLEDLQATFVSEAQRLKKKDIRLIKQTGSPSKDLVIKSDEVRLKQLMTNLLSNALKFTDKGNISFGYSLDKPGTIRFFVKDQGVGISKSAQRTLFQRFRQTQEGRKDKYKGTGLGLAISKGIVELMEGRIGVNSAPGKGSEFYFLLPLVECD